MENTSKFLFVALALLLSCSTMQAQFGKRLGKSIENAAKNATVRKAEQKTDEAVSRGIDKATDPNTYKDRDGNETKEAKSDDKKSSSQKQSASNNGDASEEEESAEAPQDAPKGVKAAEMAYAKSDFVPGDEIIFEDNQANEQMGEFPSMWDLLRGNAEIISMEGQKGIMILDGGQITPLMKTPKNYLTDQFTIEFDYYKRDRAHSQVEGNCGNNRLHVYLLDETGKEIFELWYFTQDQDGGSYDWKTTDGESRRGDYTQKTSTEAWHHVGYSFNKRAFKAYLDGNRMVNIPNMAQAKWIRFNAYSCSANQYFIRNVRIAKGAVPLYDRMMTDGKFITCGITFDVGKSTIKPESMGEINRIVKLMTDNPELKFSVEGHTDNTGNAASNQTLSEARSKAVADKLVEMGINKDRLQSAGKGQTSPLADNATDEGRAKNRRVEFVKI